MFYSIELSCCNLLRLIPLLLFWLLPSRSAPMVAPGPDPSVHTIAPSYSPGFYSPLRTRAYLETVGLTSTYPQTEMKNLLASLEVMCGKHVESPRHCWFSRPGLLYKSVATQIYYDEELAFIHSTRNIHIYLNKRVISKVLHRALGHSLCWYSSCACSNNCEPHVSSFMITCV